MDLNVECEGCDEATAHRVQVHLAQFSEQLEAVLSTYLSAREPELKFTFGDEDGEEWK